MSEPSPDDLATDPVAIAADAHGGLPRDVEFVVPASAYDSIATDDELTRRVEPVPTAPAPMVDLGPISRAVEELGRSLGTRVDALAGLFEREIRAEATREKVVDRLHAELQEYKQDLLLSVMRPVFVDLIQLHDDVGKMAEALAGEDGAALDPARFEGQLRGIQQGIEDVLYRQGIEPYRHEADGFDARRQRAVSTVSTSDPGQARKVAERHRKGFLAGEKVIRPEIVSVFVHRAEA